MANTSPRTANTIVNDTSTGTVVWNNPSNAKTDNNVWATVAWDSTAYRYSNYLKATDFGFSIPTGSTINGILVETKERWGAYGAVVDNAIRIVKGGTICSTDLSSGTLNYDQTYRSHGGTTNLWGETWTAEDINSSGFGFAMSVYINGSPVYGQDTAIDNIRITIYYTLPPDTAKFFQLF